MPTKAPAKKPRKQHRDMPEDPRLLAKAMFNMADRKMADRMREEGRAAKKPATQGR